MLCVFFVRIEFRNGNGDRDERKVGICEKDVHEMIATKIKFGGGGFPRRQVFEI